MTRRCRGAWRLKARLPALCALGVLALAGCGSTKTIVTVEKQVQTVTRTVTQTAGAPTQSPTTTQAAGGTKCGGKATYCPVVVDCPIAPSGGPSPNGCYGAVGILGYTGKPIPGPDTTGLGLSCSWSQPVLNAERTVYDYICDPGP